MQTPRTPVQSLSTPTRYRDHQTREHTIFTPSGTDFPFKQAALRAWRSDLASPKLAASMKPMTDIWVDDLQPLVSLQPFSAEEEQIISSGHLCAQPRRHNATSKSAPSGRNRSSGSRNREDRRDTAPLPSARQDAEEQPLQIGEDAEEEILWADPKGDTVGSFDSEGNFHLGPPVAAAPVAASQPAPAAEWYYRDPSGQTQGPFASSKMLEWYNRRFFPDTLPLKREQDHVFEPLSVWKSRSGGMPPFAAPKAGPPFVSSHVSPAQRAESEPISIPVTSLFATAAKQSKIKPLKDEEKSFLQKLSSSSFQSTGSAKENDANLPKQAAAAEKEAPIVMPKTTAQKDKDKTLRQKERPSDRKGAVPSPHTSADAIQEQMAGLGVSKTWSRPVYPTRSIAELQKEDASRESKAQLMAPSPKSFADLLKSPKGIQQQAKANPGTADPRTGDKKNHASAPAGNKSHDEMFKWSLSALKPLSRDCDLNVCVGILQSLAHQQDICAFLRDNLSTDKIDLHEFAQNYLALRFGTVSEAALSSLRTNSPKSAASEEFITVTRKGRK